MKKLIPYSIALVTFIIISLAYFHPVLEGKKIIQSDIVQFTGSAKEINDYRKENNKDPYWTNTSFSGMPAYNVSALYPNDYARKFDKLLRFLPIPADYLFLYFLGFFILLSVLKVDWKLAIIGSLAFGFSTYYIVILGVGHNSKAHAIAYFPMVIAGIILVFKNRYFSGFILTSIAMALEINARHPQMTYYLLFSVIILGFLYLLDAIKTKKLKNFTKSIGILFVAVTLGVGINATNLLATKQYAKESSRSTSELTINADGSKKEQTTGLEKSAINRWSYGITETFNLFIPRFMGGGSRENLGSNSNAFKLVKEQFGLNAAKDFFEDGMPTYWGKQPGVSAPAYIGAIMFFLFVLGIFMVKNNLKKWLVATAILSVLLSYGKNFGLFTNLFVDYVPLYNKFRAITSIQVLTEMAIPLLGILALKEFFSNTYSKGEKINYLKKSLYIVGGIALFFTVLGTFIFNFEGANDRQLDKVLVGLSDALISDRKSMLFYDSLRSLLLVSLTFGVLFAFIKEKINYNISIVILGVFILFDLIQVDKRYVNADNFKDARKIERPFTATKVDTEILKDKSHYRVFNIDRPYDDGRTPYFHNSISGYHAAKPRRYQELFDFQISKMNEETLNMLNTKYFMFSDDKGKQTYQKNPDANGNAWFINKLTKVTSANEEIKALDSLKTKVEAVYLPTKDYNLKAIYPKDTTAIIKLTKMETTKFTYNSFSTEDQFAVFSETYFKDWVAYIDGIKVPIIRVDYVLRGLEIPKGKHVIKFEFQPKVVTKGNRIVLVSYILLLLIPIGWYLIKRKKIAQ